MDKNQYQEWSSHPLTKLYHRFLLDYRQKLMEDWAAGNYNHPSVEKSAMHNSTMLGRAVMLQELNDLAEDAISEFYSENRKGDSDASGN